MHCDSTISFRNPQCDTASTSNGDQTINKAIESCRGNDECIGILRIRASNEVALNFDGHTCKRGEEYFALCMQGTSFSLNPNTGSLNRHGTSEVGQKLELGGKHYHSEFFI